MSKFIGMSTSSHKTRKVLLAWCFFLTLCKFITIKNRETTTTNTTTTVVTKTSNAKNKPVVTPIPKDDDTTSITNASSSVEPGQPNATEPTPKECRRHCPTRPNRIYLALDRRRAGIGDRVSIVSYWAQLAGSLCAILVLPPPSSALVVSGDNDDDDGWTVGKGGRGGGGGIVWEDYINLTFVEDSTPVVSRYPVVNKPDDYLRMNSTDGYTLRRDFAVLQSISWHQPLGFTRLLNAAERRASSFVWEIDITDPMDNNLVKGGLPPLAEDIPDSDWFNRYENRLLLARPTLHRREVERGDSRGGCTYTNSEPGNDGTPSHLTILRRRLMDRISQNSGHDPVLIFLHLRLRRGDDPSSSPSSDTCDAGAERLRKLVACSLGGVADVVTGRNVTVLMGSDGVWDVGRRRGVVRMVAEEVPYVKPLDVDGMAWDIVQEAVEGGLIRRGLLNRQYVYLLQQFLRVGVGGSVRYGASDATILYLEQGGGSCRDCFDIKNLYKKSLQDNRRY